MNGIIHPCCNPPEGKKPESESEMFENIFRYLEELVELVKPKNLIYMAIDGVAPRAKMNQQRARRFRKVQEEKERGKNGDSFRFDSNVITPGTPFMFNLAAALHRFILRKLENEWKHLQVIFSDSNNPGEGEHKILEFVRVQRTLPNYNPNTKHVIYGPDADLIMLSLITHEAHFYVVRESLIDFRSVFCKVCGKPGHFEYDCLSRTSSGESLPNSKFQFIRIPVLRQYLFYEFKSLTRFSYFDLERIIDDFVFLCFFVGNDFLPHLPSLHIRDGAIDGLIYLYTRVFSRLGGYLTDQGKVILYRVDIIMQELSKIEEDYFKEKEERESFIKKRNLDQSRKRPEPEEKPTQSSDQPEDAEDSIRMGQEGWKLRYYSEKFKVSGDEVEEFRNRIHSSYMEGLSWVFEYYHQGCVSWSWYFPFHYAPFASDLFASHKLMPKFDLGRPFQPYAQLLAVLPSESCSALPVVLQELVLQEESEIIDFYPKDFKLDINGKRFAWQGVILLPFIEEDRLLAAIEDKSSMLSNEEIMRNSVGETFLYSNRDVPGVNMRFIGKTAKFTIYHRLDETGVKFDVVQNHQKMKHLSKKLDGVLDVPVEIDESVFRAGDRRGFGATGMINMISKYLALNVMESETKPQKIVSYQPIVGQSFTEKKIKSPPPQQESLVDNLKKLFDLIQNKK
jgi:5'-3' exoribonuclease 2